MPAVARACRVLRALGENGGGRRLSDLSRELELSKSTLSGLLSTLEGCGLVERDPVSRTFRLGLGLLDLSAAVLRRLDLREAARPVVERLRDASGETAILHVWRGGHLFILERAEPDHQLKVVAPVGHRLPSFAGSAARALLAALPEEEAEELVRSRPLPVFTPRSIDDPGRYLLELARARRDGYALEDEEYLPGVRAASAPVLDAAGQPVATVSVVAVSARMPSERMHELAAEVAEAARALSRQLGARSEAA